MAEQMIQMCKHGIWSSGQTACSDCDAPTPAPSGEAANFLVQQDSPESLDDIAQRIVVHFCPGETVKQHLLLAYFRAWGDRCRREGIDSLKWAIDYIADGADYEGGDVPKHDCDFSGDSDDCDFHERFFTAVDLLLRAALTPPAESTHDFRCIMIGCFKTHCGYCRQPLDSHNSDCKRPPAEPKETK